MFVLCLLQHAAHVQGAGQDVHVCKVDEKESRKANVRGLDIWVAKNILSNECKLTMNPKILNEIK